MSVRPDGTPPLAPRELALDVLRETCQQFTLCLARAAAGHDVDFRPCASDGVGRWVERTLRPLLLSDVRLAPDFGQFAELRVEGDLLRDAYVRCDIRLDDRSALQDRHGQRVRQFRRMVTITATLSTRPWRFVHCSFVLPRHD